VPYTSHLPVIYATDNKTDKEDALKLAHLLTGRPDSRLPLVPVPDDREMRRRGIFGIVTVVRKKPATDGS
jgi:hypothetical protein